ncbi:arylsulfatase regulatory protein, putative [Pyrococcus sp. NA2]|nr:arylsulfatase regulatory protein, putative [Pyrococcus sp. NA2]
MLDFLKKEGFENVSISYGIVSGVYFSESDIQKYLPYLWKETYRRRFKVWTSVDMIFGHVIDPELKVYSCWETIGG